MGRKRALRNRAKSVGEWAEAKQTLQLADDAMNVIYQLNQIRLAQFDRLVGIAKNYQFFRFTKVEMRFKPYSDTYIPGQGVGPGQVTASIPYFYHLIDKGTTLDIADFNSLRDAGCKPVRFDDRTVNVSWKPAVIFMTQDYQNQFPPTTSVPKPAYNRTSPWLATSANAGERGGPWIASEIDHTGILYGCEQNATVPDLVYKYGVELTVHCQFKKPLNAPGSGKDLVVTKQVTAREDEVVVS